MIFLPVNDRRSVSKDSTALSIFGRASSTDVVLPDSPFISSAEATYRFTTPWLTPSSTRRCRTGPKNNVPRPNCSRAFDTCISAISTTASSRALRCAISCAVWSFVASSVKNRFSFCRSVSNRAFSSACAAWGSCNSSAYCRIRACRSIRAFSSIVAAFHISGETLRGLAAFVGSKDVTGKKGLAVPSGVTSRKNGWFWRSSSSTI